MLALQIIAFAFLALSVAFLFGPRLAVYGPRALSEMAQEGQVQFVSACLASILVLIVGAPYISDPGSSTNGDVLAMADHLT